MPVKLNLLIEKPAIDTSFEYIEEETNKNTPNTLYIKGPFMQHSTVNKNNRSYDAEDMRREVKRYNEEMVIPGRAMGELNHPPSADVNLERACHIVTDLYEEGNVYYGKSKILSTPCGQIIRSLINDGVRVGMSSRALGTLDEGINGAVVRNMNLVAIDCVADPSFAKAFVNGILESKQWVLDMDGHYEESYDTFESSLINLPRQQVDDYLRLQIMEFINKI